MPPATMRSAEPAATHVVGEHRRLHARSADLVDRRRLGRAGKAGAERGLAGGGLAEAGGEDAAHEDLVDRLAVDPGALDRGADRGGAQFGGAGAGEGALEAAHRGAGVGEDDDGVGGLHRETPNPFGLSLSKPVTSPPRKGKERASTGSARTVWVSVPGQGPIGARPALFKSAALC